MIAICPNPYRDIDLKLTREAIKLLEASGYETCVCPVFSGPNDDVIPKDLRACTLEDVSGRITLAVVIGGDGTILAVAREMPDLSVPLLGVNLGTMGFMASLEPENLGLIVKAAAGEFTVSPRMLISAKLEHEGTVIYEGTALNDAVIHGYGDTIYLNASSDGTRITTFSGDGIIISTPTGSTGYSMSAGGPIVEPEAGNIIISPICAHTICSKSFVLNADRVVTVTAEKLHDRKAYLSIDGIVSADVNKGDLLTVKRSENCVLIADMGVKSFYETTFEKLTV
ncbi:MAG: NAD(+)/NADH kinase [Eubacteriales bacterium]|nr:NAD(+)/NADH kinase [Eubacteriales bacterium]